MPVKLTYADRVICQLCVRGAGSFTPDELIDEVICTIMVNEENISKVARTYIRIHIIYLRSRYLLVRDKDEDGKVYPAERLAAELERIPRNVLDNDPTKMKKYADLVKIGAYPLKRLTVKELRQRLLEMQDERDDLRQDRDRLLKECEDLKAELADAREGCTAAEEIPMDIDAEEEAHEAAPGTPSQVSSQPQSNAAALRRTPTLDYIDPVTPPRRNSTNASQYLLTPPDTDERPRKRLSKTGSRAQQVSFRDDNLNTDLAMDASNAMSGPIGTHELTTPQTDLTSSMLQDVIDAGRREMNGIFERMAAAATAEREGNVLREQTLQNDKAILTAELKKADLTRTQEQCSYSAREQTLQPEKAAQAVALQAEKVARKEAGRRAQEAREEAMRVRREKATSKQRRRRQDNSETIKMYERMIAKAHVQIAELRTRVKFHAHSTTMEAHRARREKEAALVHTRSLEQQVAKLVKQTEEQATTIQDQEEAMHRKDDAIQEKNNAIRQLAEQMKACSQSADALAAER